MIRAIALALAALAAGSPAGAVESSPPTVSERELRSSVRRLDPVVRSLKPVVRPLRTEQRQGDRRTVTISADVLFEFNSAELTADAARVIEALGGEIRPTAGEVVVVGHTDALGADDYNQGLSERRAAAVADVVRRVVGSDRPLRVEGRGEREPVQPNEVGGKDNPAGRAQNRRVVISFSSPAG